MKILTFVFYAFCTLSSAALAQSLPAPLTPFVSDHADLIAPKTEAAITKELRALKQERGAEMVVVTIKSRTTYGDDSSLEAFATKLFNDWGIGDKNRNDGILFLVSRDDRETRIELGAGYAPIYDDRMKAVIDNTIVPHFRRGDFATGIDAGVLEIIKRTDYAFVDAPTVPKSWLNANKGLLFFSLTVGLITLLKFRGKLRDSVQRLRRCPTCGNRTISVRRRSTASPDLDVEGAEERTVWCSSCDYYRQTRRTIPRKRLSTGSGSFGGGRSGGGGASGRW